MGKNYERICVERCIKIGVVKHANVNLAFVAGRHVIGKYPGRWW
jgi:hypothetical protein